MELNLQTLREVGAFTGAPVERTVTWVQGDQEFTATVYVKPLSYKAAISDIQALAGRVDGVAGRIAASICDAEGRAVFTPGDITGEADPERGALNGNLTVALLTVIAEVNNPGKTSS
ncbi:Phage tail assembly chaperone, TAC [compost metagenome]